MPLRGCVEKRRLDFFGGGMKGFLIGCLLVMSATLVSEENKLASAPSADSYRVISLGVMDAMPGVDLEQGFSRWASLDALVSLGQDDLQDLYSTVGVGLRIYPFGTAPNGPFLQANAEAASLHDAPLRDKEMGLGVGYQWEFLSGWAMQWHLDTNSYDGVAFHTPDDAQSLWLNTSLTLGRVNHQLGEASSAMPKRGLVYFGVTGTIADLGLEQAVNRWISLAAQIEYVPLSYQYSEAGMTLEARVYLFGHAPSGWFVDGHIRGGVGTEYDYGASQYWYGGGTGYQWIVADAWTVKIGADYNIYINPGADLDPSEGQEPVYNSARTTFSLGWMY
jgi:hypothetical protein